MTGDVPMGDEKSPSEVGSKGPVRRSRPARHQRSGQNVLHHMPENVGEPELTARVVVGEAGVVEPQKMEQGGVEIGGVLGVRPIVRREEGVGLQWVQFPPGNWVAPAGSYRGGGGGNEIVGAFETDVSPWRCSEPTGRNASER